MTNHTTNLKKTLKTAHAQVALRAEVKERMRQELLAYSDMHAVVEPLAPVRNASVSVWSSMRLRAFGALAMVLVVAVTGAQVTAAAEGALPGDLLYPVKVSVAEPVSLAFASSPAKRATLAAEFAGRRIDEASKLSVAGKLDEQAATELAIRFDTHATVLAEVSGDDTEQSDSEAAQVRIARVQLAERLQNEVALLATAEAPVAATLALARTESASADAVMDTPEPAVATFVGRALATSMRLALIADTTSSLAVSLPVNTVASAKQGAGGGVSGTATIAARVADAEPAPVDADVMLMSVMMTEPTLDDDSASSSASTTASTTASSTSTTSASAGESKGSRGEGGSTNTAVPSVRVIPTIKSFISW